MRRFRETRYFITRNGDVINSQTDRVLNQNEDGEGYYHVMIYYNRQRKTTKVHKLVAEVYLGNPNGMHVNHKDCNKLNNHVSNLEYVTRQENMTHAVKMGRLVRKINTKQAIEINNMRSNGMAYKRIAAIFNVSYQAIQYTIKNKTT